MEDEIEANEKKKEVYVLISVKPKYAEEFCIMMVACKELCERTCKSKNLAKIDDVFSVLGPFDFLLELSGEGKNEEEMDKKINKTIFKIRETLGSYIDETCTLTKFDLSKFFENEVKELLKEAKSFARTKIYDQELKDFLKETFMTHGDTHEHENNKVFSYQTFNRLFQFRQELDRDNTQIQEPEQNKKMCLFTFSEIVTDNNQQKKLLEHLQTIDPQLSQLIENAGYSSDGNKRIKIAKDGDTIATLKIEKKLCYFKRKNGKDIKIGVVRFEDNKLNIYEIKKTKDVHVLIKIEPEYTEQFCVAMAACKSLCNRASASQNLAKIDEVFSVFGLFDFLLKIRGEGMNKDEKINKTIFKIRETLGSYINETLTITKFKIPITKGELGNFFEKNLREKYIAKLPDKDGETIPDERLKPDNEIDLIEIYDAETTPLKKLLRKAKTFWEPEDLNKRIDDLTNRVDELEKRS